MLNISWKADTVLLVSVLRAPYCYFRLMCAYGIHFNSTWLIGALEEMDAGVSYGTDDVYSPEHDETPDSKKENE